MLLDLRAATENPVLETDICVIGAGIAGMTVARRFLKSSKRVVVLESGGLRYDEQAQEFNDGASTGMRYYDLRDSCRVHGYGNLYAAGSSTFATAGWANPTFTIVALALRLGEHLARKLDRA